MAKRKEPTTDDIVLAIDESNTLDEAAAKAGTTKESILISANCDPEVLLAFRDYKRNAFRRLTDDLTNNAVRAVAVLSEIMNNSDINAESRIKACEKTLIFYTKLREVEAALNKKLFIEMDYGTDVSNIDFGGIVSREYPSGE